MACASETTHAILWGLCAVHKYTHGRCFAFDSLRIRKVSKWVYIENQIDNLILQHKAECCSRTIVSGRQHSWASFASFVRFLVMEQVRRGELEARSTGYKIMNNGRRMNWGSSRPGGLLRIEKTGLFDLPLHIYFWTFHFFFLFFLSFFSPCQLSGQLILLLYKGTTIFLGTLILAWTFPDLNSKFPPGRALPWHFYTWRIVNATGKGWGTGHKFPIWEAVLKSFYWTRA